MAPALLILAWLLASLHGGSAVSVRREAGDPGDVEMLLSSDSDDEEDAADNATGSPAFPSNATGSPALDECSRCDFTVDFRCSWVDMHGPFHRIKDCVLPSYALVWAARRAKGRRCAIVSRSRKETRYLEELLGTLARDVGFSFVRDGDPCVEGTKMRFMAVSDFADQSRIRFDRALAKRSSRASARVPMNATQNLEMLRFDAARVTRRMRGGRQAPDGVLVLVRQGTRAFTARTLSMIKYNLAEASKTVNTYTGSETVAETLRLFQTAGIVVGYHGAGFVNTLFRTGQQCAVEFTTYVDLASRTLWRSNRGILADKGGLNPTLKWIVQGVPLDQLLRENNVDQLPQVKNDADHLIKRLQRIVLRPQDFKAMMENVAECQGSGISLGGREWAHVPRREGLDAKKGNSSSGTTSTSSSNSSSNSSSSSSSSSSSNSTTTSNSNNSTTSSSSSSTSNSSSNSTTSSNSTSSTSSTSSSSNSSNSTSSGSSGSSGTSGSSSSSSGSGSGSGSGSNSTAPSS